MASTADKTLELIKWLKGNGASFDMIEIKDDGVGGIGLYARDDIESDECYARISSQLVITDEVCRGIIPESEGANLHGRPMMCAFLVYHRFVKRNESFWKPYIDLLPSEFHTPLHFTSEELSILCATPIENAVKSRRELYQDEYKEACRCIPDSVMTTDQFTFSRYLWAATVCTSRAFSRALVEGHSDKDTAQNDILLPLLDIANHYPKRKVMWRGSDTGVEFVTLSPIRKNEQIFNNYGPKSNEELMMGYGFCIKDNPFNFYHIKLNFSRDPQATSKSAILDRAGINTLDQYIRLDEDPSDLMSIVRVMVIQYEEVDLFLAREDLCRQSLDYISLRNEIKMYDLLIYLLDSKMQTFLDSERAQPSLSTENAEIAKEYRRGIYQILQNSLSRFKQAKMRLLTHAVSLITTDNHSLPWYTEIPGQVIIDYSDNATIENADGLEGLLSRVILTPAAFKDDDVFLQASEQIDADEDVLLLLFLIRCLNNRSSPWYKLVKRFEGYSHRVICDTNGLKKSDPFVSSMEESYEDLFPMLTDYFPDLFIPSQFTRERVRWAAELLSVFNVTIVSNYKSKSTIDGVLLI